MGERPHVGNVEIVCVNVQRRIGHALVRRMALHHRVPEANLLEGRSRPHRLALFPRYEPHHVRTADRLLVRSLRGWLPGRQPLEIVERKGLGHPDTLCDAISERICARLCRYYRDRFGVILHHNVDKVLLCGGASRPAFRGGEITVPMELYLAGRAARTWRGEEIPVDDIAVEACQDVLRETLPSVDASRHVRIVPRIRHGSVDLVQLFARGGGVALANDTSCGAGFAPATDLERIVLGVEQRLNSSEIHGAHPGVGSDIKVMGVRHDRRVWLTVGCAILGRHVPSLSDYVALKHALHALAVEAANEVSALEVDATINAADDL